MGFRQCPCLRLPAFVTLLFGLEAMSLIEQAVWPSGQSPRPFRVHHGGAGSAAAKYADSRVCQSQSAAPVRSASPYPDAHGTAPYAAASFWRTAETIFP